MGEEQETFSREDKDKLQELLETPEQANPFAYDDSANWNAWELTKCILGIVVVPIRLTVALFALFTLALFANLSVSCGYNANKPMSSCRRVLLWPAPFLIRLFLFSFGFYYIKVKGRRDKTASVCIGVPHSTFVDAWVVGSQIGLFSGLGKLEAQQTPVFGALFRALQIVPVDRNTSDGRKVALEEFVRRVHAPEWGQMLVFPEGTCTNRKSVIQFKRGAFVPGAPVQTILLRWPYRHFDPTWTSSSNRIVKIFRLMTQIYNNVEVEFLEPYVPGEEEIADPELFAENVRQIAASELGVPTTEHSYADSFLSMAARKSKANPEHILQFEFATLNDLFKLDLSKGKRLMKLFISNPKAKKSGTIGVEAFAKALGLPLTSTVVEFFSLLDRNGSGEIDFRTFVIGLAFIGDTASRFDNGVDLLYHCFDPKDTGKVTTKDVNSVLDKVFRKVDKETVRLLFKRVDPENTGYVEKERFKAFLDENKELLVLGVSAKQRFDDRGGVNGRKLTVFTSAEARAKLGELRAETMV